MLSLLLLKNLLYLIYDYSTLKCKYTNWKKIVSNHIFEHVFIVFTLFIVFYTSSTGFS